MPYIHMQCIASTLVVNVADLLCLALDCLKRDLAEIEVM